MSEELATIEHLQETLAAFAAKLQSLAEKEEEISELEDRVEKLETDLRQAEVDLEDSVAVDSDQRAALAHARKRIEAMQSVEVDPFAVVMDQRALDAIAELIGR